MAVECAGRQPELALETGGVRHRAACWSPLYTPISASCWASVFISYNREPVQAPCHSYRPSFLQNFPRGDDSTFRGNALTHILLPLVSPPVQGPELLECPRSANSFRTLLGKVMQQLGQKRKFRKGIPLLSGWQLVPTS